jgi:hypothetical protein
MGQISMEQAWVWIEDLDEHQKLHIFADFCLITSD